MEKWGFVKKTCLLRTPTVSSGRHRKPGAYITHSMKPGSGLATKPVAGEVMRRPIAQLPSFSLLVLVSGFVYRILRMRYRSRRSRDSFILSSASRFVDAAIGEAKIN